MITQTLSSVTLETIENYRNAATLAVESYRTGSNRLIDAMNVGLEKNLYSRTARVAPQLTDKLKQVRGGLTDIIVKGVDKASSGTEKAIEVGSTTATERVIQIAEYAGGIENSLVANGIDTITRLSMPGAQLVRKVSAKVAEGADALARAAAGKNTEPARVVKAVKREAVRAKRTVVAKTVATRKVVANKAATVRRKAKLA